MDIRFRPREAAHGHIVGPRVALLSILGFWLFYYLVNTLRAHNEPLAEQIASAEKRAGVMAVGMALSYGLYLALRPFDRCRLGTRIGAAFFFSVPTSVAYAATNYVAFYLWRPTDALLAEIAKWPKDMADPRQVILDSTLNWYFFVVAWAVLYVALSYAAEVRLAERRAAGFRAAAQAAELRALRYQVNPHFLFNTLNSLSSLVLTDKRDEAERMILNLSTFFRTSLTGEPTEDVPLAEEIRLQRLYLDIEAVRFPERLRVEISVPHALASACVPGLILQPLVENAIKYGVSRARRPVTVRIGAREDSDGLVLSVEDDGEALPENAAGHGTGVGLRNVRERLTARFGAAGVCRWGARPEGGFAVTLFLPLTRGGAEMAERVLRTLVVDDEPLAIERLQILCAQTPGVELIGAASDGEAALRLVDALAPELILLDIAMPGLDGMGVARALEGRAARPAIIFCTAFDQFAVAAFDVAAVDYLLKPVSAERLAKAVARVTEKLAAPARTEPPQAWTEEFWVPHRSEMIRIAAADIDRIDAERDYMRLHVGARSFLLHQTISELERRLDPARFIRLHRSTIVRRDFIAKLRHDGLGVWAADLRDGAEVRIGRTYLAPAKAIAGR